MGYITKTSVVFSVALVAVLVVFAIVLAHWTEGIDESRVASSATNGVRGGNNPGVADFSNGNHQATTSVCLVSLIDIEDDEEIQPNKKKDQYYDGELEEAVQLLSKKEAKNDDEKDNDMIVCNRVSGKSDNGVEDEILLIQNLDDKTIRSNKEALMKNEWFISFSDEWVEEGRHQAKIIVIPEDYNVETIELSQVPHHNSVSPSHRRQLTSNLDERRRKLRALGARTVVVVSVALQGTTKQQLYEHVFGNSDSLVSQMGDCSQGQVTIVPHPAHPVIEVKPSKHVSQYTFVELYMEILGDVRKELGIGNDASITSTTDHLLLVVPDDVDRRPGELGWGATPGFFSGIIESLAPSTMTMLHEVGHNFGLGHAYEKGEAYSDMSTVMGYSHRGVVRMCYNGHNMWDMGWFEDRSYSIEFSNDNNNDREIVKLAWYGDYSKTTSDEPVIIRYRDVYMTFNRKLGMNQETKEYGDMLLVVQEMPGEHHSHTDLIAALGPSSQAYELEYNNRNRNAFIEVCSYTPGDNGQPEYLTVAVGKQSGGCPHESLTTMASSINVGGQGNRGAEVLATDELQPIECKMMWPWVELKSTINPAALDIDYVLCQAVATDPERYCEQIDDLSQEEVWKVCRLQCPQAGCVVESSLSASTGTGERRDEEESNNESMCEDLFSWVEMEIEDEHGSKEYTKKTCEELGIGFSETREFYCKQYDTLTHLPVSEICRAGCLSNGCSE